MIPGRVITFTEFLEKIINFERKKNYLELVEFVLLEMKCSNFCLGICTYVNKARKIQLTFIYQKVEVIEFQLMGDCQLFLVRKI